MTIISYLDRMSEGMRELEPIVEHRDVMLCAPLLLIYAHKKCTPVGELTYIIFKNSF